MFLTIEGSASGIKILKITLILLAPVEMNASITPLGTSEKLASESRAKKQIAARLSGTRTASDPILVPTIIFERGKSKTIRIKNGTD